MHDIVREKSHFFYDYADRDYHIVSENNGFRTFLRKAGKILEDCPKSNAGIYVVNIKTGKSKKFGKKKCCCDKEEKSCK